MRRITRLVVQGDSLSDRGTLDKRKLLGVLPMSYLSGLSSKSPKGRFTNGYLWGDYVSATTAEDFEINHERRKLKLEDTAEADADISDEFLTDSALRSKSETAFSLNDDMHVLFRGQRFARFYCEGGLTAYDYATTFTFNPTLEGSRLILATLEEKRKALLADDKKYAISKLEKSETLVIEWSGANDLITVNSTPTHKAADNAVTERMHNIEALIQNGYRNIILFNLPNLSLTPRFQARSKAEQDNASDCSEYFNAQLKAQCDALNKKYKDLHLSINLSVFDVDTHFKEIYNNPEQYSFDKGKLKTPFTSSKEFEQDKQNPLDQAEHLSPADGYMFWDDVHPTADTHSWLAELFKEQYDAVFDFIPPQQQQKARKDDFEIGRNTQNFWKDTPKPTPKIELPEDIEKTLDTLHENAKSMCNSWDATRREKGELLKEFIFELKCQKGNLEEMHGILSAFTLNVENMKLIQTHNNPIYDFLMGIKTTRSEDTINDLAKAIKAHMGSPAPSVHMDI